MCYITTKSINDIEFFAKFNLERFDVSCARVQKFWNISIYFVLPFHLFIQWKFQFDWTNNNWKDSVWWQLQAKHNLLFLLESITDRRKVDMNILRISIYNFVSNLSYYRQILQMLFYIINIHFKPYHTSRDNVLRISIHFQGAKRINIIISIKYHSINTPFCSSYYLNFIRLRQYN